jgi:hypothetical protein
MVAAGDTHTVGLRSDGTALAAGNNGYGQCNVSDWTDITQIAAGYLHTVGLRSDGTVVAVGYNGYGECTVGDWTDITQVSTTTVHTVGLKSDGTVVAVGRNLYGECDLDNWAGITQVAAGGAHTVGLKSDGTVVAVGNSDFGECNVDGWSGIAQVTAAAGLTVGLKSDGTVVAVGRDLEGQASVTDWTGVAQVAAHSYHTVGLRSDGTVVAMGWNEDGQCNVSGWTGITQVAAGWRQTVGLRSDGTVVAVGNNDYGQCGVFNWNLGTANRPPDQPTNVSPSNGATGIGLTPTLHSSTFSDPDVGDTHAASQWQIRTCSGTWVFDSGPVAGLTSIAVPQAVLSSPPITYFWHVMYQDNHGNWSDYSSETSFATGGLAELGDTVRILSGPDAQGWWGTPVAYDSVSNRFLVVSTSGGLETAEVHLCGQLVAADGGLYGPPIAITSYDSQQLYPQVAFDPASQRFLVTWMDNRNTWSVFGQLVTAEGSLYGNEFAISPTPQAHQMGIPKVQFDTVSHRYLVMWSGMSYPQISMYGQFVSPEGTLQGDMFEITSLPDHGYFGDYNFTFDPNNDRFLLVWHDGSDGFIHGYLLNADGTLRGSELVIGHNQAGLSLCFDPTNSRFFVGFSGEGGPLGQLVNADGSLCGTEFSLFDAGTSLYIPSAHPSVVFDTANNKFLVTSNIDYPFFGVCGQFLNPDGSSYGEAFQIHNTCGQNGTMGYYPPTAAYGSAQAGSLVVWMDVAGDFPDIDVFGRLVNPPDTVTLPPVVTTNDATNVATTSARLNGNLTSMGTASSVTVSFEWKVSGGSYTPTTGEVKTSTGTSYSDLAGLTPGTTYYYRAKAAGDSTVYGAERGFTTLDTVPPPVPALVSPANWKKINNSATLDWSDVSDPSGVTYQIRLYNSSWSLVQEKTGLTSSAYAVSSFGSLADGTYYWKVRAMDGAGNASAWTTSWAFKLDKTLPSVPVHLSPTSWKKINSSATLDWSDVSDPSGVTYQARLYNSSWSLVKEKTGLTSSAYAVSSFGSLADGTYYWRVRTLDGAGNASGWTTSWAFKLDNTLPSMPVHLSPTSWKKINSSATLDWSDVSDPSGVTYQIRLYNSSWSLVKEKTGLTSSAYTVNSFGSLADGTYYWRVRTVDGAGNASAWTTSWAFKLDSTVP